MNNRFVEIIYIGRNLFPKESWCSNHQLLFLMLSNISQAPWITRQGIRAYEMQDTWIWIQGISLHQAWLIGETFLISKEFLGRVAIQVWGKFFPRGGMKMADQSKESFLSRQIICYTKHFIYNIPCKHLINSKAYGQPMCCLAVKLSLSLDVEALVVRAGSCTAQI